MKPYLHGLLILFSFLLVFVWQNSDFQQYTIPFVGFLVFIFLLVSIKNKKNLSIGPAGKLGGPVNFFVLNTVILLFIFSTGGLTSNLFFILYFLLFAASFIMDPKAVFVFPLGVLIVFWSALFKDDTGGNILKVAGIVLLSPIAYYLGNQFKRNETADDKKSEQADEAIDELEEIPFRKSKKQDIESPRSKN